MKRSSAMPAHRALSAEEMSALFRRDPENERLYRESEIKLDLAERMTEMRRAAGLSQQELADRVGRKQPFVARLELGAYDRCGLGTLRTFARAMGFDIDSSRMFVQATAAHYSGLSSCADLEDAFEMMGAQSDKLATISLAAWEHAAPFEIAVPAIEREVNYSAA